MYYTKNSEKNRRVSDSIIGNFIPNLGLKRDQVNAKSGYFSSISTLTTPLPWAVINFDIFWVMLSPNGQCKQCDSRYSTNCNHGHSGFSSPSSSSGFASPTSPTSPIPTDLSQQYCYCSRTPNKVCPTGLHGNKRHNHFSSMNTSANNIINLLNQNQPTMECYTGTRGKQYKCISKNQTNNNNPFWPNLQRRRKLGVTTEPLSLMEVPLFRWCL